MDIPCLKQIALENILSFGPDTEPIELGRLNVLVGPNGSGKSNLLEAIGLLRAAPRDLSSPVKESGGVREWLWKGAEAPTAKVAATIDLPEGRESSIRHSFSFKEHGRRFEVEHESIHNVDEHSNHETQDYRYLLENGCPRLYENVRDRYEERSLKREDIAPEESILSQVKDPDRYPVLTALTEFYSKIRIYREWSFGRHTPPRQPQKSDLPSRYLSETCENMALVLNSMRKGSKKRLISALGELYPEVEDFNVEIDGGWVQLYLEEKKFDIPATRLSDGTLRYLCLLAILCHQDPPSLVCIEEPELGLHPDVLPRLAGLMVEASAKCQLVVTTHSDILVDAFTDTPECVVVCEKEKGRTAMKRLEKKQLTRWLKEYRLGELWLKGEIGGTRW